MKKGQSESEEFFEFLADLIKKRMPAVKKRLHQEGRLKGQWQEDPQAVVGHLRWIGENALEETRRLLEVQKNHWRKKRLDTLSKWAAQAKEWEYSAIYEAVGQKAEELKWQLARLKETGTSRKRKNLYISTSCRISYNW